MDYLQYKRHAITLMGSDRLVLNLIINGLPSILYKKGSENNMPVVLNLIINGLPSIFH